jgi:hypothetical protein
LGNGDGTFQPQIVQAAGATALKVAVADFNGDGFPDLVTANPENFPSNGFFDHVGKWKRHLQPPVTRSTAGVPSFLAIADLNGDGKPDLVFSNLPCLAQGAFCAADLCGNSTSCGPRCKSRRWPPASSPTMPAVSSTI